MLKCNVRESSTVYVQARGPMDKLVTETAVVVQAVYRGILAKHPEVAKEFRNRLLGVLLDPESPVWKEPDDEY